MEFNNLNKFIFDNFDDANRVKQQAFEVHKEQSYLSINDVMCLIHKENVDYPDIYKENGWITLDWIDLYDEIETKYYNNQGFDFHVWVLNFPFIQNIKNRVKIKEKENKFKWKQKYLQK